MILVLTIILFIIFLIYSIRPSKSEEYTLEGLKLSWANKASIEGIVTKWIVTLKDSSGSVIHTYENSDAGNLKDFTDVTMNIVDKKEFNDKIIGNNTLELYYNEIKPDTKLYTKTVTFTQDDFGMSLDMSNLEEIDIPVPTVDLTGGFKWYYYKGSYFSDINSFSGKTSTKQGENVTDFSSKHKATSGHLRNDGNEDNYSVKWEGYFVPKKTGSHKFWTESDDMSYLTIDGVVAVDNGGLHGMVKAPKKELNPPESSRKYSSVWSNQAPGVGHARSMLDSDQAWSAAHNVVDQWMEIDMGTVSFIGGVVVQGRKNYDQRVTSFDVFIDGKKVTSTLKYTSSRDTRQSYTFGEPVVGRKVRFRVKGWYSHTSMRAGVIPAKSINLTAGKKYSIKIYFGEKGGGDELKVWFQGPGMSSAIHDFSGYMVNDNTVGTSSPPPPATPTNQDCEGHWINDPTGRSSSKAQKNYKTMKYVVTKPKSGTGKDCMWAFTRKNPHKNATDVTRNWAGYAFGNDQWTSEVVTDGQKGEVFNYQNTKGYRMNDTTDPEEWKNLSEWKQNYLRFCMRKPNVAWNYSKNISGRNKDIYTDAYGTTKSLYHECDDDD